MEISLAEERVLLLDPRLSPDEAQAQVWERKQEAFGTVARVASFINKPRDDEFEILYTEQRYQPFWHLVSRATYVYERQATYTVPLAGREVEAVTIHDQKVEARDGQLTLRGTEHCREQKVQQTYIDGLGGSEKGLAEYLEFEAEPVPAERLDELAEEGLILVPPKARASAVVRDSLVKMIRGVQADRILEDSVEIERVDLYYRPVYAYRLRWHPKEREAVLECDGLTGAIRSDGATFQQYVGKLVDREFLLDIGTDTVDLFVPGGGIALKIARKGISAARNRG